MIAFAFGPGSDVTSFGSDIGPPASSPPTPGRLSRRSLTALPARARRRILEQDTPRGQILADRVGAGELAALPRLAALDDQPLDLGDVDRRRRILRPAHADEAEDEIEVIERRADHGDVVGADL